MTSVKLPWDTMCASVLCVQKLCFRDISINHLYYIKYMILSFAPLMSKTGQRDQEMRKERDCSDHEGRPTKRPRALSYHQAFRALSGQSIGHSPFRRLFQPISSTGNIFSAAMNQIVLEIWLHWAEGIAVEVARCAREQLVRN